MAGTFDDIIRSVLGIAQPAGDPNAPRPTMRNDPKPIPYAPSNYGKDDEDNDLFSPIADVPYGARVPTDVMSDVGPVTMGHWIEQRAPGGAYVDVGNEVSSPVDPVRAQGLMQQREIQRMRGRDVPNDVDVILRAMQRRQQMGRD